MNKPRVSPVREYDIIIVGSGAGLDILDMAVEHGHTVALIDRGPIGGTCLNVGCIPSKMLIFPADRIMEIRESAKLGIDTAIPAIDFKAIMNRMRHLVNSDSAKIEKYLKESKALDFYHGEAEFIDDFTLAVGDETIKGKQIYLVSGSRPLIPPIPGLDTVEYLTNETLLDLEEVPKSMVVLGGGYIGVEYAHFFEAMGTDVTIIEMRSRLLPNEEPEVSAYLQMALSRRMTVQTECTAESVEKAPGGGVIIHTGHSRTGMKAEIRAQRLLMATGRRSNADLLKVSRSGIAIAKNGYIKVNSRLETNVKGIYALGDAIGREMFTHTAHAEAEIAGANGIHGQHLRMDFTASPHAVFTHPQIASVGLLEEQAAQKFKIKVGRADYGDIALGSAMMQDEGFAKIIMEARNNRILGCHIIGPWASVLIQEVINAMARRGTMDDIAAGIHIHPALSELIVKALFNAAEAE
ncbi:dihydrolipoamide dehydrogenase [Dehalogenimonas formicexedens]|uniref:Dihydrolipoamide dehydrogenase n=1 Tax=Dehalogenimonas formicexedens TaxID=1839801 RepID=A0A1P8F7W2_9CHLR|nr:dihydrolipoyl dehydrogenase [Dehalogenimonas formicexedens]APV44535.1 dihydrolipoamide dehydrogenase [Dehalogenimonas formicexedens]